MNDDSFMPGIVIGIVIGFAVTSMFWFSETNFYKAKAVELQVAEWVLDAKTGKTTFTWKETK